MLLRCSFQNSTVFRIVAKAFGRYVCIFASNYLAISSYFLISFSIRQTRPCTHRYATTIAQAMAIAIALLFNVYLFICFFSPIYSKRPLQYVRYSIILDGYKNGHLSNAMFPLYLFVSHLHDCGQICANQ